jgi:predicted nucleic acid-binding Zn finger protein
LKCDGAETKFSLLAKQMSLFKSAGASVQLTTGSQGVRIIIIVGSNAGYTMF